MSIQNDLNGIAERLKNLALDASAEAAVNDVKAVILACRRVAESWSGSCLGYHASVYYEELDIPPSGAFFSTQWGLRDSYGAGGSRGAWVRYSKSDIEEAIIEISGNHDILDYVEKASFIESETDRNKDEILSIIENYGLKKDPYLRRLFDQAQQVGSPAPSEIIRSLVRVGSVMSNDLEACSAGARYPVHAEIHARALAVKTIYDNCEKLSDIAFRAARQMGRIQPHAKENHSMKKVFVGHGRYPDWRDLKDFLKDRLHLEVEEFNSVPTAGYTIEARLSEMLDNASFAFLVMSGEDQHADGSIHARMNVAHEVGLFQGRLGFRKAIVMLQNGCGEFSNINGIIQIRYDKDCIMSKFEEVRGVLEREGIIPHS